MHVENCQSGRGWVAGDVDNVQSQSLECLKQKWDLTNGKSLQKQLRSHRPNSSDRFLGSRRKSSWDTWGQKRSFHLDDMYSRVLDTKDAQAMSTNLSESLEKILIWH